jgi:excisionase family DNA binding protein
MTLPEVGMALDLYRDESAGSVLDRAAPGRNGAELLTVREAAEFLKVTVSWIYEHVRPAAVDRLPVLKIGKYLRFDARDLRAYVDAKREAARHTARRHTPGRR